LNLETFDDDSSDGNENTESGDLLQIDYSTYFSSREKSRIRPNEERMEDLFREKMSLGNSAQGNRVGIGDDDDLSWAPPKHGFELCMIDQAELARKFDISLREIPLNSSHISITSTPSSFMKMEVGNVGSSSSVNVGSLQGIQENPGVVWKLLGGGDFVARKLMKNDDMINKMNGPNSGKKIWGVLNLVELFRLFNHQSLHTFVGMSTGLETPVVNRLSMSFSSFPRVTQTDSLLKEKVTGSSKTSYSSSVEQQLVNMISEPEDVVQLMKHLHVDTFIEDGSSSSSHIYTQGKNEAGTGVASLPNEQQLYFTPMNQTNLRNSMGNISSSPGSKSSSSFPVNNDPSSFSQVTHLRLLCDTRHFTNSFVRSLSLRHHQLTHLDLAGGSNIDDNGVVVLVEACRDHNV
jgi:hypothetical protein